MGNTSEQKPEKPQRGDNIKEYVRYSGLAFQMIGAMVIAAFAGQKLDKALGTDKPWFTITFLIVAIVASMVLAVMSLIKK
ncbi:AtpZ/AtpI family protein [Pontibacter sp. SGAir0037]|uniref:AtpZ/AtpI family protein n=1 Tax=Pontibacter sp. SGAir0037 TaxID=2571030 RepID=UPI0010CCBBF6|nr:AtpZ/AtpI family protein [Pontibacter sp. SGAir0037]QCR25165.1 hypothetical protein C1N53_18750 [Pontibacter sp. SGAir0037]